MAFLTIREVSALIAKGLYIGRVFAGPIVGRAVRLATKLAAGYTGSTIGVINRAGVL